MNDQMNWKTMRPQLLRRNAERAPIAKIANISVTKNKDYIDFNVLDHYNKNHLYSKSNCNKVIDGYVRDINNNEFQWIIPSDINRICLKYYFLPNTATFQIAFKLWKTSKMITDFKGFSGHKLVTKLPKRSKSLIKHKYIELTGYKHKKTKEKPNKYKLVNCDDFQYNFSMRAKIEFQEYRKYLKKRDGKGWNAVTVFDLYQSKGFCLEHNKKSNK